MGGMEIVNTILIAILVVLQVVAIIQLVMDRPNLKQNAGMLVGLVIWMLVVVAIGFQELPWLRTLIEKKA